MPVFPKSHPQCVELAYEQVVSLVDYEDRQTSDCEQWASPSE